MGHKSGHAWLTLKPEQRVDGFQDGPGRPGDRRGYRPCHRRQPSRGEDPVDEFPQRCRLSLADEKRSPGGEGVVVQGVGRQEVGTRRVIDVGRVDQVRPVADASQGASAGLPQEARNDVVVAWAPDQVRPQGHGA